MVSHGVLLCLMVSYCVSWCLMVSHGIWLPRITHGVGYILASFPGSDISNGPGNEARCILPHTRPHNSFPVQ